MPAAPCRLLLVEDSATQARLLRAQLTALGYEVLPPVPSAALALVAFRAADPPVDAAVLDIGLAGPRDGLALAADLQAYGPLPIVFITAHDPAPLLPLVGRLPAATLLRKPLNLLALADQLALALASAEAADPVEGRWQLALNRLPRGYCFLHRDGCYHRVRLADIRFAEACGKSWRVVVPGRAFLLDVTLADLLRGLARRRFVQIHRSYVVNVRHIDQLDLPGERVMVDKQCLPVSRRYRAALLARCPRLG